MLFGVLAGVVLLVGGGAVALWGYTRGLNHNVNRTDAFRGLGTDRPSPSGGGALNVLVLGSDSRDPAGGGTSRTDTIMLVHLDGAHRHAYVISIPRDTWVDVPRAPGGGSGHTKSKINSAYARGGVPLTVQTVEQFTQVRVDHVILIDFAGFKQVVDALGGVDMMVDQTITSIFPPHRTYRQGMRHFTGTEALDYVRQRYQFANGDFTREQHQQQLLKALLDKAAAGGILGNVGELNDFLQAVTSAITVDQGLDVVGMGLRLRGLRSSDISFLTSPSSGTGWADGQEVVFPDTGKAAALYHAVGDDTIGSYLAAHGATAGTSPPTPGLTNPPAPTPTR